MDHSLCLEHRHGAGVVLVSQVCVTRVCLWASGGCAFCRHRGKAPPGLPAGTETSCSEPMCHPSPVPLRVGWHRGTHHLVTRILFNCSSHEPDSGLRAHKGSFSMVPGLRGGPRELWLGQSTGLNKGEQEKAGGHGMQAGTRWKPASVI